MISEKLLQKLIPITLYNILKEDEFIIMSEELSTK